MQPVYYKIPSAELIFVANPKCATSSLLDALSVVLPERLQKEVTNPHYKWEEYSIGPGEALAAKQDRLCVSPIRNPWARAASHYKDKIASGVLHDRLHPYGFRADMSFDSYVDLLSDLVDEINDYHVMPQTKFLFFKGTFLPDFLLRFERLEKDYWVLSQLVTSRGGPPLPAMPHENRRSGNGYRSYYNKHTRRAIRRIYSNDIEFFGYHF